MGLVQHWLRQSSISYSQFVAIVSWGVGEEGLFDKTVLCRIMNDNLPKGCSIKTLMALGAANEAIFMWKTEGPGKTIQTFGFYDDWGVDESSLKSAIWLPHPHSLGKHHYPPGKPMSFTDLCQIQVGSLTIPCHVRQGS